MCVLAKVIVSPLFSQPPPVFPPLPLPIPCSASASPRSQWCSQEYGGLCEQRRNCCNQITPPSRSSHSARFLSSRVVCPDLQFSVYKQLPPQISRNTNRPRRWRKTFSGSLVATHRNGISCFFTFSLGFCYFFTGGRDSL